MQQLDGKVAIITGAGADGIGRRCGTALAKAGAKIVFTDLNKKGAEESAKEINRGGDQAIAFGHDVSDETAWRKVVDGALEKYGRIDILMNNAGEARVGPIESLDLNDLHFLAAVNLDGAFLGIKAVWSHLKNMGGGSIINTASLAGEEPNSRGALYCASKAALIGLTKAAALEGAPLGIRVNALLPGMIWTPGVVEVMGDQAESRKKEMSKRIWQGDWGKAQDVANVCLYLASDTSRYLTGIDFKIDGGGVAHMPSVT